jgi:Cu+-exporting ATPase
MKAIMAYQRTISTETETVCYHCGESVRHDGLHYDSKEFCCAGCKAVYDILTRNNLCQYYTLDEKPGIAHRELFLERFAYLDDADVSTRLREFSDGATSAASFFVPQIHCSSCVWLLENLHRLNSGILRSRVDFLKKRIAIRYSDGNITLRQIVELLTSLGYEPQITLDSVEKREDPGSDKSLYYRIGVAAFCFSNIMILAFPEYLSGGTVDLELRRVFAYLSLVLSLPVFFYGSVGYFQSAYRGLRTRVINIDVPIALGILILFARSVYDILSQTGPGYLDSMSGLVLFLLVGKLFQNKTYDSLNFERNYKSYFPLAVLVKKPTANTTVSVSALTTGDRILIRNNEIVPADSVMLKGEASIDYSFVTGESRPVGKMVGDLVYAGGRHVGGMIELEVVKEVSQSYLAQLWNDAAFRGTGKTNLTTVSNTVSKYFTAGVLVIASATALYWFPRDYSKAWDAITGVLIVACPCALALAVPFAFGSTQRIFGRKGFYLKNAHVIEALSRINTVVFDKTGTLTCTWASAVDFVGDELSDEELEAIASLVGSSHHPLSRTLSDHLGGFRRHEVKGFKETPNAGIEGRVNGYLLCLGSRQFVVRGKANSQEEPGDHNSLKETRVYVSIDGRVRGFYALRNSYREGIDGMVSRLQKVCNVKLLSGDGNQEREHLGKFLPDSIEMRFNQTPADKLNYISSQQQEGKKVMMVGDGLNDAGALQKADVGIALTDDISSFSPACDAILGGNHLASLDTFIRFSKSAVTIVLVSFGISFMYNLVALSFAFQGMLSPIIAAILMPLSSITVVVLATASVHLIAERRGLL